MAGVQSIQCPKCGSPLEVTPSTSQARCSYCGSMLRVSRDASGQPLAVLDDIRTGIDILALDAERRQLHEKLEALRGGRHAFSEIRAIWKQAAGDMRLSGKMRKNARDQIEKAEVGLREADAEIAKVLHRLQAVRARLDQLREEL